MTQSHDALNAPMPADFDDKYQAWYKAVAGVFARVQRKDVADVPLDVWKKLIRTTYDGIDVRPLYTRADDIEEQAVPGQFPFVRGNRRSDPQATGWGVTEAFGTDDLDIKATNQQLLDSLYNGTSQVVLDTTAGHISAADIATVLEGVLLHLMPVRLHAGKKLVEVAKALFAVVDTADNPARCQVECAAAPLTALVSGEETISLSEAVDLATKCNAHPGDIRAIMVDGVAFSNAGGSDAQEIAYSLAAFVDYLRALVDAGLDASDAIDQISVRFAATDDQFNQIAKFRAARGLFATVAATLGAADAAGAIPQHAVTAPVMFSQRDPWVNMLRSTVAAFAAGVGGATDVEVLTFDSAVPGGWPKTSRSFARRIARNTNLLLLEESHLGFVTDPGGGSFYIESLTEELAAAAWKIFQDVESRGGFAAAVADGSITAALDATAEQVRDDIAHRVKKVTGINEFPNLLENPLDEERRSEVSNVRRWAAQFEALRNRSDAYLATHGHRPKAVLIPLGPLAKHNVRTGFATNLLASGGIEAINPGQLVPGSPEFAAAAGQSPLAVLCAADPEYVASGPNAVQALRELGHNSAIVVAGSQKSFADVDPGSCPDDYVNMTIDAAHWLDKMLTELGA